jgi:hypothetical protein
VRLRKRLFSVWGFVTGVPPEECVPLKNCAFTVHPVSDGFDVLTYYDRVRSYAMHEDHLINSRLTWSLTVHGFLFASFGVLAGKIADIIVGLHNSPCGSPPITRLMVPGLIFFQFIIATFGAFVAYRSRNAILAAHTALQHLRAIVHSVGRLKIVNDDIAPSPEYLLLPKIVSGGAAEERTSAAHSYYLGLPGFLTLIWCFLALVSFSFFCVGLVSPASLGIDLYW